MLSASLLFLTTTLTNLNVLPPIPKADLPSCASVMATVNYKILGAVSKSEEKEIGEDADFTYKRFRDYFGVTLSPIEIDVRSERTGPSVAGAPYLPWITEEEVRKQVASQVPPEMLDQIVDKLRESRPLTHEIGHMLLITYVADKVKGKSGLKNYGIYGSPYLPDWIDEAVAITCERDDLYKPRLEQAKANLSDLMPLKELFSMKHPMPAVPKDAPKKSGVTVITGGSELIKNDAPHFYPQVASVCEFMKTKAGEKYLKIVVDGVLEGKSMDEILPTITGLPSSVEQLEKEWKAWLAK